MMNIDDGNLIIKETVYKCMINSISFIKLFDEFGFYQYALYTDESNQICMGFKTPDFAKIFEYSGKETLEKEFAGYEYELNAIAYDSKFDIVLKINISQFSKIFERIPKELSQDEKEKIMMENQNLKKELELYATKSSELFSRFRIILYTSVIKKMLIEIFDKKKPESITLKLDKNNNLYLIPFEDKLSLIFGITFNQKTDVALSRSFLQELEDSKRHVKANVDVKYYPDFIRPPMELKEIENNPKQFSSGIISFNLYVKYSNQILSKLGYFINFKNYIQYHIHSIKTYLHIRMNKKGKDLERKLNEAKIIPDDYLKSLETQSFFSNLQKKNDDIKLFTQEFKKVNV